MAKKKKNNKNTGGNINIVLPEKLSADEIKSILVEAMLEVESHKEALAKEKSENDLKEWRNSLGIKDYSADKKVRFRRLKQIINTFYAFFRLSFLPKKQIKGDRATIGLLKFFLNLIFEIAKDALTFLSVILFAFIPLQFVIEDIQPLGWIGNVMAVCFGLLSFVLSRLFRIASAEIDRIDDKNYLFGIFAAVSSIVSIVIAVISIFIKGV